MVRSAPADVALNAICPYFTMFPLDFPLGILKRQAKAGETVLDPFCGRGTTNFAARLAGLQSLGVDSSPVAAAVTVAKLVRSTPGKILRAARDILESRQARHIPEGEFWQRAYHPEVLDVLCRLREGLLEDCRSHARLALRAIVLGALHGPQQKTFPGYFSNQSPRTYAPKPAYAIRYWKRNRLKPKRVDSLELIGRRATRFYAIAPPAPKSGVHLADSRRVDAFLSQGAQTAFDWVITSPPYYGMRTYIPDQWLRNWFVGGQDVVDYSTQDQVAHDGPDAFSRDLRQVWKNALRVSGKRARMVIRFGGIRDRRADPLEIIKDSLQGSGWTITTLRSAGTALDGKRQAESFLGSSSKPMVEYDVWARR